MSEDIERIQAYLTTPKVSHPVAEHHWHDHAVDVLLKTSNQPRLPQALATIALDILRHYPFEALDPLLNQGTLTKPLLRELRLQRRVLTVARDTLNMSNAIDLIDVPETEPLRTFIMDLGIVSDTKGQDVAVLDSVRKGREDAATAAYGIPDAHIDPITFTTLEARLRGSLATDLLVESSVDSANEETYHLARQSFRAVVYTGLVSDSIEPRNDRRHYVLEGLRLNGMYGDRRYVYIDQQEGENQ
jgi:hypothetical protein